MHMNTKSCMVSTARNFDSIVTKIVQGQVSLNTTHVGLTTFVE